uniref:Ig-like domain-containing protein n=1 Tax=Chelonoidis abingdonii TaxID=106734 RepID=A0A8C0J8Q7_CHEAB
MPPRAQPTPSPLSALPAGALAGPPRLTQTSPSHVVDEKIPRLHCQMSGSDITTHVLSWYHQPPDQGPVFLLSHRAGDSKPAYGVGISERFIASLERDSNTFSLTIGNVKPADAGTYFCAVWYANQYLFGEGTRLILGGPVQNPTGSHLDPAFLCLAWGFSPEPIRVRWQVDGQEPGPGEGVAAGRGPGWGWVASLLPLPPQLARSVASNEISRPPLRCTSLPPPCSDPCLDQNTPELVPHRPCPEPPAPTPAVPCRLQWSPQTLLILPPPYL